MRIKQWLTKSINVILAASLLSPGMAFANTEESPNGTDSASTADQNGTTKNWLTTYVNAKDEASKKKEKKPDDKPSYTKEKVLAENWDSLHPNDVWQAYRISTREMLQIASYFYPLFDKFLSHNEQVEKYQWTDEIVIEKISKLTKTKYEQISTLLPAIKIFFEQSKLEDQPKPTLQQRNALTSSSLASSPPDAMYDSEGLTYQYKRSNTDNPVDELYRTANVREIDLQLNGKHGMDFTLERSYSSLDAMTEDIYYSTSEMNRTRPLQGDVNSLKHGWSLNFPRFQEIYKSNTNCTKSSDATKYSCGHKGEGERYLFTLEDGTVLESSTKYGTWVNTPFQGATMVNYRDKTGEFGEYHMATLRVNGDKYDFGEESRYKGDDLYTTYLVKKTNPYGDTIHYRIPDDHSLPIEITDSVGRYIVMDRLSGSTQVRVYQDSSKTTLLKHLEYEWGIYTNQDRVIEHDVSGTASKVIAEYMYHDANLYGKSEFNFKPDYTFLATNGVINFDDNGIESSSYTNVDKTKRGTVNYKLLKQVNYPVEGLSMTYTYSLYNPDAPGFLDRGVVRLYQDKEMLTYTTYHPVTAVNFRFAKTPHPDQPKTEWYSYTKYYPETNKEIWKSPKSESVRFATQSLNRDGSRVVTSTLQDGLLNEEKTFVVNEDRNFLLQSVKKYVGLGSDTDTIQGELKLTEDDKTYLFSPVTYTSYLYNDRETKPTYVYTFPGRPASITADQDVYSFLLAPNPDKLSKVKVRIPRLAQTTEYDYNKYGDVTKEVDPKGNVTVTEYVFPGTPSDFRLPGSIKKTAAGNPSHYHQETYTYGGDSLLATEKIVDSYPDGTTTRVEQIDRTYSYEDKQLRYIAEASTGPDAKTTLQDIASYEPMGLYPSQITMQVETAAGKKQTLAHSYSYDGMGRLTSRTYPDNTLVQFRYDLLGRKTKELVTSKEQTRTTSYAYDDAVRKVTMTMPNGTQMFSHFTPYGEVEYKGQIGTNGEVRPLLYNTYSLDANHLLSSSPFADNNRATTFVYNADGTVWQKKEPMGTTVYLHANTMNDGTNNVAANTQLTIEPNGLQTTQYHDRHGQLEKEVKRTGDGTQSLTTHLSRNDFDQVIRKSVKDHTGENRTWEYRYTNNGNLVYLLDPEQNKYRYEYDSLGNLVTVTENQVLTTKNHYNALSWKISEQDVPSGATESYSYNANGTTKEFRDKAGNNHTYEYTPFYDVAKLVTKNAAGVVTNVETKEYVPNTSLLQKETNSNGAEALPTGSHNREMSYTYDPFQRLKSQTVFGRAYQLGYADHDDLMDTFTYPDSTTVTYSYDSANRLQEVNSPLTGLITYDYHTKPNGESYQIDYPNGRIIDRNLDSFGQVENVTHLNKQDPVWTESNKYSFGNVVSIQRNGTAHQYNYDNIDRLTKEEVPSSTNQYSYDGRGNRSAFEGKLPTDIGTTTYTYDERNRLRSTSNEKTGTKTAYTYFGDGLRATKVENGDETKYVYLNGKVIEELDAAGNVKARNIWGNDLLYRKDLVANKNGYYGYNSHGDVVSISDENGQDLNTYEYDTWGNVTSQTEGMSNPFKYSGEIYDEKTGFYYLRARYYDPTVGRFISEDTYKGQVDNPLTLNRYTYVENNPLRYIDPTGHWKQEHGANWVINEAKNKWELAQTVGEKKHWENYANDIRAKMTKTGYSQSDIMQSSDAMIPDSQVMKMARESAPGLTFIADFNKAIWDYPGEAAAVKGAFFIGSLFNKGKGFDNLSEGLNFAARAAQHMDEAGRFVPVQIQQAVIKYGKEFPDPRGSQAKMYYDVMYREGKKYNIEVLYDAATNTVYHFEFARKAMGHLPAIPK